MNLPKKYSLFLFLFLYLVLFSSCKKEDLPIANENDLEYMISGSAIMYKDKPIQLIGANAFHVFSVGSSDMNGWNLDIAREFIGNSKETPLTDGPIQSSSGSYLYSLQSIVDDNRRNNRITILCAFGWDGNSETEFTGKSPTQTSWWNAYKVILAQWAVQFKNQPDVWIEVWNEPYRYDRADGYTDAQWINDMTELSTIIRGTGNKNIILIPCAEQGQDESVLLNKANEFLANKSNILFDIHGYEKWLLDKPSSIDSRLSQLQNKKIPIIFGETAPMNAGLLMNPKPFLDILSTRGLSVCAWVWKKDATDQDALLTTSGLPNDNNNNNWGTTFKNLSLSPRNP
ncbi:cellulase family glycosylhydrolase [Flavobacterium degerlachei]|jgi:mannan endo-1,4-beta-mannosidase|uniref:Mannan endo-1,4-beta-mannosidase n=1 Tax=Flavobacterium degerlachei TaxID=229203 RepID=A0A1H2X792_9FLAO|nr:cellulase family glycosylhydrolase [Flavobacterium degerlachei]SDW88671.1 mannan endo-1,4-beta-mannosidase [Flavobacterium degerlachei]